MQFNLYYLRFIMRIILIGVMAILCLTQVLFADSVHAQILDKKISIELPNGNIAQALHLLESEEIFLAYDDSELKLSKKSIRRRAFVNAPVSDVLTYIFAGTGLTFREIGSYIMLEKKRIQRPGNISGRVYDERGRGMAAANIKVLEAGTTVQTGIDGSYQVALPAGTYNIEITYLSYQTQRVQGIRVLAGQRATVDVAMKVSSQQLEDVIVTSNYKRSSVSGLYAAQKNAASVTDGISAEQIARTPDNDMGQVLKRVTGITTINNRNVIVRGMSDRYNQAMLDGVTVPSTSMNRRDFAFDIIPSSVVSSVVVNKTATPDVSSEFSGGQISINTLDIPDQNFTNIQIGAGGNSQTTGKDFFRLGERKTSEYFGFFDRSARQPDNIQSWDFGGAEVPPPGLPGATDDMQLIPGQGVPYSSLDAVAQSKRLSAENLRLRRYTALPDQNYLFAIGRRYNLQNGMRFGFSASANIRNEYQITPFNNLRGSTYGGGVHYIDSTAIGQNGAGTSYRFSSSSGLVANFGLQGDGFKVSVKNMYARTYIDNYYEAIRINYADVTLDANNEQFQQPSAMSLQQHQLNGEFELPWDIKMTGLFAYNRIKQQILDERKLKYLMTTQIGDTYYFQTPNISNPSLRGGNNIRQDSRMWTDVNENDFNWGINFSKSFAGTSNYSTLIKAGYQGWAKRRDLSILRMIPYSARGSQIELPYEEALDPANMGSSVNQAYYWAENINGPIFNGRIDIHALYIMADQKLWHKLRLVYGLRGESFQLDNNQEALLDRQFENPTDFILFRRGVAEKGWRWLPSINATYEVTPTFNVRAAYSRTAIRPDFRESSFFGFYDMELDGNISGDRVESTIVDNVDMRLEWYPSAGEIVSLTGYYKYLDRPIELVKENTLEGNYYVFANMASAKNLGLELEVRKNFGFLGEQPWLRDFFVYGNGSLLQSEVDVLSPWRPVASEGGSSVFMQTREGTQNRPLLGQSPWLVNVGLGYWGQQFGMTASYNQRGYRTNLTAMEPFLVEFEKAPRQLDAQLYARFLKSKLEVKLNMANLLNEWAVFYTNSEGFDRPDGSTYIRVLGDDRYNKEDGDTIVYRRREGQRFNILISYNF